MTKKQVILDALLRKDEHTPPTNEQVLKKIEKDGIRKEEYDEIAKNIDELMGLAKDKLRGQGLPDRQLKLLSYALEVKHFAKKLGYEPRYNSIN